jgi:hypothetical protein
LGSLCILKVELTRCPDGLDVGFKRKRSVNVHEHFWPEFIKKIEWLSTKKKPQLSKFVSEEQESKLGCFTNPCEGT